MTMIDDPNGGRIQRKPRHAPVTLAYFEERSIPEPNTGCWLWTGATRWNGYGAVRHAGRTISAHRLALQVATGDALQSSVDVCHRCDTRACVNPDHLFAGTRTENMRDCANKGRIRVPALEGELSPNSKLTADQVRAILGDVRSQRAIARSYGVDRGTIACIKNGKTWRSISRGAS